MQYDVAIVGGGHNSLVAAAYLAKNGKKVVVLEKNNYLGGCSSTSIRQKCKLSTASYVISLFDTKITKELKLKENGLEIIPRVPSSYTPDPYGPGLLLGQGRSEDVRSISHYSEHDAIVYAEYNRFLDDVARKLEPIIMSPPPQLRGNWLKKFVESVKFLKSIRHLDKEGVYQKQKIAELLTGAAMPILDRWFESDIIKGVLATDAIIGANISPYDQGSAYVLLHHVMGEAGGARGVWGYVRGGMGGLASSLHNVCHQLGVDVITDKRVQSVYRMGKEKTWSLYCYDETVMQSDKVVFGVDLISTMKMLKTNVETEEQNDFQKIAQETDYTSTSAKLNFVLDSLPDFGGCLSGEHGLKCFHGTIHLVSDPMQIEDAHYQCRKNGVCSDDPILEITIPSVLDNTLTPDGRHVMSIFAQYCAYDQENNDKIRDQFYQNVLAVLKDYDSKFEGRVLEKQVLTPYDLEVEFGITGGNIFQGSMIPHQMHVFRPAFGYGYETPFENVYMCGAATHPGGGVIGACGYNAAMRILKKS